MVSTVVETVADEYIISKLSLQERCFTRLEKCHSVWYPLMSKIDIDEVGITDPIDTWTINSHKRKHHSTSTKRAQFSRQCLFFQMVSGVAHLRHFKKVITRTLKHYKTKPAYKSIARKEWQTQTERNIIQTDQQDDRTTRQWRIETGIIIIMSISINF